MPEINIQLHEVKRRVKYIIDVIAVRMLIGETRIPQILTNASKNAFFLEMKDASAIAAMRQALFPLF